MFYRWKKKAPGHPPRLPWCARARPVGTLEMAFAPGSGRLDRNAGACYDELWRQRPRGWTSRVAAGAFLPSLPPGAPASPRTNYHEA